MPKVITPDSKLTSYIYPYATTHCNTRNHVIDTITIHHAANGEGFNCGYSKDTLNGIFTSVGQAGSCHYGVDSNGNIGQMLNEAYRSWCTNSRENDYRAICIECANCKGKPTWEVSDKALAALINLCADICKRRGKKKMVWIADQNTALNYNPKSDEMRMTLHRWFIATPCPEQYLISKMQYIADEVNKIIGDKPVYQTYYANYSTGVNYRQTPNGTLVGTYPYGMAVEILVGSETTVDGSIWVQAKNGYWSAKSLLATTKPNNPTPSAKTYTLQMDMKVRSGAGSNYSQLFYSQLTADEKKMAYVQTYAVLKKSSKLSISATKKNGNSTWGKIQSGWICLQSGSTIYAK